MRDGHRLPNAYAESMIRAGHWSGLCCTGRRERTGSASLQLLQAESMDVGDAFPCSVHSRLLQHGELVHAYVRLIPAQLAKEEAAVSLPGCCVEC